MKKLFTGIIAGLAAFAMVGTASAAVYKVNMCGASAQAGFWQQSGAAAVKNAFTCDDAVLNGIDDNHMIVKGTGCNVTTTDDTVYVRYNVENSEFGCTNYDCVTSAGWAAADDEQDTSGDFGDCDWSTAGFNCTVAVEAQCQMGCADVPCDTITATTFGYAGGRSGSPNNGGSDTLVQHGSSAGFSTPNANEQFLGVTVPFGFIANNAVQANYCETDYSSMTAGAELAYDKDGWLCDPRYNGDAPNGGNPQCKNDFKCIDAYKGADNSAGSDGRGVCIDGSHDATLLDQDVPDDAVIGSTAAHGGIVCGDTSDCADMAHAGACVKKPLKGLGRLPILLIFSEAVDNWNDFGPAFPDLAIVRCMRHGGSGTHQTLINTVFRGETQLATFTNEYPALQPGVAGASYTWHYKSSSDLTRDCVAYYAGGIGYVDADKVMFRSKIDVTQEPAGYLAANPDAPFGIHQLMFKGHGPSRYAVSMGLYNFWAQQRCFANTDSCVTGTEAEILRSVMAAASSPDLLTYSNFGQRAFFWATKGEMRVKKDTEYTYPNNVVPQPALPTLDPGPFNQ